MGKPTAASAGKVKGPVHTSNSPPAKGETKGRGTSATKAPQTEVKAQEAAKANTTSTTVTKGHPVGSVVTQNNYTTASDGAVPDEIQERAALEEQEHVGNGEVKEGSEHEMGEDGGVQDDVHESHDETTDVVVEEDVVHDGANDEEALEAFEERVVEYEVHDEVHDDVKSHGEHEAEANGAVLEDSTSLSPSHIGAETTVELEPQPESHVALEPVKSSAAVGNDIEDIINLLEPAPIALPSAPEEFVAEIPDED